MKSNCYSPSTSLKQGELLACPFQNAQKSATAHCTKNGFIPAEVKHQRFSPNKHQCIGILPISVMEKTLDISPKKQKINEVICYHSGKEITRWLIKKSEYNKLRSDYFT